MCVSILLALIVVFHLLQNVSFLTRSAMKIFVAALAVCCLLPSALGDVVLSEKIMNLAVTGAELSSMAYEKHKNAPENGYFNDGT
jgi:hypothetical protein